MARCEFAPWKSILKLIYMLPNQHYKYRSIVAQYALGGSASHNASPYRLLGLCEGYVLYFQITFSLLTMGWGQVDIYP